MLLSACLPHWKRSTALPRCGKEVLMWRLPRVRPACRIARPVAIDGSPGFVHVYALSKEVG